MKIAVSGSGGFIGTHLVKAISELGLEVICLDARNGIDMTRWEQLACTPEFDVFVHLAAKSFVPDSWNHPRDFYHTNIVATLNALELCRLHGARMLYTSSYVYGVPRYLPIDENHPVIAFNPYAKSKLMGERLCRNFHEDFGVPVKIIRPFNVYGLGQNGKFLIPTIISQAKTGTIRLNDPNPKRDFVFVNDLVSAYMRAIQSNETNCEIFNIGSGVSYSVREIVQIVQGHFGKELDIHFSEKIRANEISDTVADIRKAADVLRWQPKVDLTTGIKRMLEAA